MVIKGEKGGNFLSPLISAKLARKPEKKKRGRREEEGKKKRRRKEEKTRKFEGYSSLGMSFGFMVSLFCFKDLDG